MKLEEAKEKLVKYAMDKYSINSANQWVIFAIKGVTVEDEELTPNENTPFVFNDTIFLIKGNTIKAFLGTCEPGDYYSNKKKLDKNGAAHVANGCYEWKPGKHDGKPAFIQNKKIEVFRDSNGDGVISKEEKANSFTGWFGINIHFGGDSGNSHGIKRWIGRWSAGCIVIRSSKYPVDKAPEWVDFKDTLYKSGQKAFTGIIENYSEIF